MRNFIESRDHRLMRMLNRWRAPIWFRRWMVLSTRAGDGWLWYALLFLILAAGGPERMRAIATAVLATGMGILLFRWVKRTAARRRPCHIESHSWATLLPPDQFSFPSGHTISAFAMTMSIGAYYPTLLIPLLFFAISIAASRIVLGMHFLSDVLAGAAIGSLLAYCSVLLLSA